MGGTAELYQTLAGKKHQQAVMNSKLWVYRAVMARCARIQNPLASALLPPAPYLNNELRFNVTQLRANSHTLVIPSVLLDLWVEVCYTISVAEVA